MTTIINVKDLYTLEVSKKDKGNKDAYINIHIDRLKEASLHVPRGRSISSRAYNITFDYQYGKDILDINTLLRPREIILKQDSISYPNTRNTSLYRFNEPTGQYVGLGSTEAAFRTKGKYILLSNK